jgi:hypothetical protein
MFEGSSLLIATALLVIAALNCHPWCPILPSVQTTQCVQVTGWHVKGTQVGQRVLNISSVMSLMNADRGQAGPLESRGRGIGEGEGGL